MLFRSGLANIVVITTLYLLGFKEAMSVSFIRIVLVGFTFGNLSTMLYGMAGGILSLLCMYMAKKSKGLSIIGVSVIGAIAHNVGQILMATFILESTVILNYLPFLCIMAIVTGVAIGVTGGELVKRLHKSAIFCIK